MTIEKNGLCCRDSDSGIGELQGSFDGHPIDVDCIEVISLLLKTKSASGVDYDD